VFFQKTIYKVKVIDLKKIRFNKVNSKVATFVWKSLYSKSLKWQKVSNQEKKNEKVEICQNAPRRCHRSPLSWERDIFKNSSTICIFSTIAAFRSCSSLNQAKVKISLILFYWLFSLKIWTTNQDNTFRWLSTKVPISPRMFVAIKQRIRQKIT
jgi:hypothetical protein